jgi:hypothetical protein
MFRDLNQINFISKNFNLSNVIFKVGYSFFRFKFQSNWTLEC